MGYFVASSMESVAALMKEKRTPLQESDKKQPWPTLVFERKRAETATARGLTKKDVAKNTAESCVASPFSHRERTVRKRRWNALRDCNTVVKSRVEAGMQDFPPFCWHFPAFSSIPKTKLVKSAPLPLFCSMLDSMMKMTAAARWIFLLLLSSHRFKNSQTDGEA